MPAVLPWDPNALNVHLQASGPAPAAEEDVLPPPAREWRTPTGLPLSRRALASWGSWRDADAWGRRQVEWRDGLRPAEVAALERLAANIAGLGDRETWFVNAACRWDVRPPVLPALLAGLALHPAGIGDLARGLGARPAQVYALREALERWTSRETPAEEETMATATATKSGARGTGEEIRERYRLSVGMVRKIRGAAAALGLDPTAEIPRDGRAGIANRVGCYPSTVSNCLTVLRAGWEDGAEAAEEPVAPIPATCPACGDADLPGGCGDCGTDAPEQAEVPALPEAVPSVVAVEEWEAVVARLTRERDEARAECDRQANRSEDLEQALATRTQQLEAANSEGNRLRTERDELRDTLAAADRQAAEVSREWAGERAEMQAQIAALLPGDSGRQPAPDVEQFRREWDELSRQINAQRGEVAHLRGELTRVARECATARGQVKDLRDVAARALEVATLVLRGEGR